MGFNSGFKGLIQPSLPPLP